MQKEFKNKLEIYDNENNLLALKLCINSQQNPKEFHTSDQQSFQIGTFNLKSGEKLERHIHLYNERLVTTTSEVIIVNKGELIVEIYDKNKLFVDEQKISAGELILFLEGGHSFEILEDAMFFEIKQGPYLEGLDKEKF
jgi:hypothetical protein